MAHTARLHSESSLVEEMAQSNHCKSRLLVHTAHRRGAPATGGMAANIVTGAAAVEAVTRDKRREIEAGVDGFLIYDLALAAPCRQLWADMEKHQQQNLNSNIFERRLEVLAK